MLANLRLSDGWNLDGFLTDLYKFIGIVEIRPWKMVGAIGPRVYQSHQSDIKRKQLRSVISIKYQYKYTIFSNKMKTSAYSK